MTSGPKAHAGRELQEELRARFGVPESVKLGVNDWGWLRILAAGYGEELERRGYFFISAREVEKISARQPRLMAKHDFSTSRPWIFQRLQLGIGGNGHRGSGFGGEACCKPSAGRSLSAAGA